MVIEDRLLSPAASPSERAAPVERQPRPRSFDEFVGQHAFKEKLSIYVESARARGAALDHVLLCGPPGVGKTTMARLLAEAMGSAFVDCTAPNITRIAEVAERLTALRQGDVLFVDEIHRLPRLVEEFLYPAMEDFVMDIPHGKGAGATSLRIAVPPFTLVGATTRSGLLSQPFRDRFGITQTFELYPVDELREIVEWRAERLSIPIELEGARELASRSRGTPRTAGRLLDRVRDYAVVRASGRITLEVSREALSLLDIDGLGLDALDRRLLRVLIEAPHPVGVRTLAVSLGEEPDTVESVLEPFLIQAGLILRTPRGRIATDRARRHLGYPVAARPSQAVLPLGALDEDEDEVGSRA